MKKIVLPLDVIAGLILLLSACNFPALTASATSVPIEDVQLSTAEAPTSLSGPEMGSTVQWVDGSLLVFISAGEFVMGYGGADNPEHVVDLGDFWIYRTEATNRMYARCVSMGKCSPPVVDPSLPEYTDPELADHPVVGVKWEQAEAYCQFVAGHLPTEAQWEKTARGTQGNIYPWGEVQPTCDLLNFNNCVGKTTKVLDYPSGKSYYDVLDMAGNVFEWVSDWYDPTYYSISPTEEPLGPQTGSARSVRGSTFKSGPEQIPSALRFHLEPEKYRLDLGFRCAVANPLDYTPLCEVLAYVPSTPSGGPVTVPGGSTTCSVPPPTLSTVTYCEKGIRGINISWTPAEASVSYSGTASCAYYDADTLACSGSGGETLTITACNSCEPVERYGVAHAECDPPYVFNDTAGLCEYSGDLRSAARLCPPGYFLTMARGNDCCQIEGGDPTSYPACPPGSSYEYGWEVCVAELPGSGARNCSTETMRFDPCEVPRHEEGCTLDPATCTARQQRFCASTCSCINQSTVCP